jgi:RecA/RadA recombinase
MATKKELTNIKGINEGKIDKILEAAKKIENHGFMSGNELAIKRKHVVRITTGSPILDELLGGGI